MARKTQSPAPGLKPMTDDEIDEMLARSLDAPIATLFRLEDISSPLLREVAYAIRNECLKLYEAGLAKPEQEFKDINRFIEFVKTSGIPQEIRKNRDNLLRVLGVGFSRFIDIVELGSPIVRQVEFSCRYSGAAVPPGEGSKGPRGKGGPGGSGLPVGSMVTFKHDPLPPCWSVMLDAAARLKNREMNRQIMGMEMFSSKVHPVPHISPLPLQNVEIAGDTVYYSVEAPKDKNGVPSCGMPYIRRGLVKQSPKMCAIFGITAPQAWLEGLVGHPVEVELVDSPAFREGAVSCDVRVHLSPTLVRISSTQCVEPFGYHVYSGTFGVDRSSH